MNDKSSVVMLHASATVNSKDWDTFKKMVAETREIVASEGPVVLIHECYYQPGSFNCLIVEGYASEQAFLGHLELIKPLSEKYKADWTINRLELMGAFSEMTVYALKMGNTEVICYGGLL